MHQKWVKYTEIFKEIYKFMLGKLLPRLNPLWNETRPFPSPFLVTTGRFLILTKAFRNDYVAACSTARRSAIEKNETGGYVTFPCLSKLTQHNSTADWLSFQ